MNSARTLPRALTITVTLTLLLALIGSQGLVHADSASDRAGRIQKQTRCEGKQRSQLENRAQVIQAMLCLTNSARRQRGLDPYRSSLQLDRSATHKAGDIIHCDSFSHEACGRPFTWWIRKEYILDNRCWLAGENIAWGDANLGTPREIFSAWLRSRSHRQAIFSRQYEEIGISLRIGQLGEVNKARVWVQHFGTIC